MSKKGQISRDAAYRKLRTLFAEIYDELRSRGHHVIVEYNDPGNPYYIPRFLEIDGRRCNVLFTVNLGITRMYYVKLAYIPSHYALVRGQTRDHRVAMSPKRFASWMVRVTKGEERS